jgi:hypothetical protein
MQDLIARASRMNVGWKGSQQEEERSDGAEMIDGSPPVLDPRVMELLRSFVPGTKEGFSGV